MFHCGIESFNGRKSNVVAALEQETSQIVYRLKIASAQLLTNFHPNFFIKRSFCGFLVALFSNENNEI
jgi:hypothetical protein